MFVSPGNRRERLLRFITDERLEVDNNIAANAMRCVALGRKKYLFAGSNASGDLPASIYTLLQTAKLIGVNPETYLRDLLIKIVEGHPINKLAELMPWRPTQKENGRRATLGTRWSG